MTTIQAYPIFNTFEKFEKGQTVKVQGERGLWQILFFREDRGGLHAVVSSGGNGCRVITIDRLHRLSKRQRQTVEE